MQSQVNFSYFYGEESEQFSYFRIPRLLVRSKKFKTLSTEAKLLYGLMLDRMGLSAKHGWYDELGRVYIYYTLDEIQTDLMCGHNKAVRLLAELDTCKDGFGLIERVKQGQGRPAKIYVKKFTTTDVPETPLSAPISDFPDSEMQTSQNQTSRLPLLGSQDFPKREASYLDNIYPEFSYRHGRGNYHNHNSTLILIKGVITMKNTKKIVSLILAVCMIASLAISASAANTVDASGGTGTSSVTLSSTADGSIGGDPAATKMSVTVPTVLPIAVGTDGTVSTATDAKIVNNSFGAVKVNSVSIEAAQGWSLAAFGDKATLAHEKVNSNKFGFQISLGNGEKKLTDNKNASKQTLLDSAVEGCFMSGVGDTSANSIGIAYDAIVTPVSEAVTNTAIASVLFIIAWDAV